ncbi:hypothetical protein [Denitrobaculum tricleocarpae]|uniref:Uncharacterized protein n=1 Tax=Denitrobaculum tricleocarpae TaxID=2591009 RepID=A0A545TMY6_9PROT|nr:hypothetical protein [Denitrobaculum tricleocarpae]TQV78592.1 hypothetical protein FKG95_18745 [Denitrobaculum tricleocarpae]
MKIKTLKKIKIYILFLLKFSIFILTFSCSIFTSTLVLTGIYSSFWHFLLSFILCTQYVILINYYNNSIWETKLKFNLSLFVLLFLFRVLTTYAASRSVISFDIVFYENGVPTMAGIIAEAVICCVFVLILHIFVKIYFIFSEVFNSIYKRSVGNVITPGCAKLREK